MTHSVISYTDFSSLIKVDGDHYVIYGYNGSEPVYTNTPYTILTSGLVAARTVPILELVQYGLQASLIDRDLHYAGGYVRLDTGLIVPADSLHAGYCGGVLVNDHPRLPRVARAQLHSALMKGITLFEQ